MIASEQLIPSEVTILGSVFDVRIVKCADDACGESDAPMREIKIDPHFPYDTQVETFYHEVIHIMLEQTGLSKILTEAQDEQFAQALGVALAQLISSNLHLPG